jgi:hypothetical protein
MRESEAAEKQGQSRGQERHADGSSLLGRAEALRRTIALCSMLGVHKEILATEAGQTVGENELLKHVALHNFQ